MSNEDPFQRPVHCFCCGVAGGVLLGEPCEDCQKAESLEAWAEKLEEIRVEANEKKLQGSWIEKRLKELLVEPGGVILQNGLQVEFSRRNWRKVDYRRFSAEDPETFKNYTSEQKDESVKLTRLMM